MYHRIRYYTLSGIAPFGVVISYYANLLLKRRRSNITYEEK